MSIINGQKIYINNEVVSEFSNSLATVNFSWSCYRKHIYDFCQRKYFLHYYASANGWDLDNCSEFERELYLLKNLRPLNYVIKDVFLNSLTTELQTFCGKINAKKIVKNIHKTAKKELLKLLKCANNYQLIADNPKRYAIYECFYCVYSVAEIKYIAVNELKLLVDNFCREENYFFNELLMAKNGDVKFHKTPDDFLLSNTMIWVAPDLIYESKGVLNCLNLRFGRYSVMNAFKLNNNVVMLYLMNKFSLFKDKIILNNFYYENSELKSFSVNDFDAKLLTIQLNSSIETLRIIANKNILQDSDFPEFAVDKALSCDNCNFKSYCNKGNFS